LLDGGLAAWTASGFSLSAEQVVVMPAEFQSVVRNERVLRTSEINQSGVDMVSLNLIDARDRARFAGELEPIDTVAGHIPGARNLPFAESMDENGRWKSADELRQLWRHHLGDDCRTEWAVMCGSGVTACHIGLGGGVSRTTALCGVLERMDHGFEQADRARLRPIRIKSAAELA
jgi:thiosulfate/3-mercaptopyruvate sulfurtransferase